MFGELLPHALVLDRGLDIRVLLWRVKEDRREAFLASYRIWQEYRVHCAVKLGEYSNSIGGFARAIEVIQGMKLTRIGMVAAARQSGLRTKHLQRAGYILERLEHVS